MTGVFVGGRVRKWNRSLVDVDATAVRNAAERSREHLLRAHLDQGR